MTKGISKLDMHVHTEVSRDSDMKLTAIEGYLKKHPVLAFAILDHNEIKGALELKQRLPHQIIVGEEIKTNQGEVAGLFLQERIPHGKGVRWTVDAILEQGGLIYVPHPLDRMRTSRLSEEGLQEVIQHAHILEIYNARNIFRADDQKAYTLATEQDILKGCGSDAHTRMELARSYISFAEPIALDQASLLVGLKQATPIMRRSFIGVHFITKYKKMTLK